MNKAFTPKTRKELAAAYGVSVRTIYRWLKELGIPADRRPLTRECLQKLYASTATRTAKPIPPPGKNPKNNR